MQADPDGYRPEDLAELAQLLARIPDMTTARIRKLAAELQDLSDQRIDDAESAEDLIFGLGRSSLGLAPLHNLQPLRKDWFTDVPAVRAFQRKLTAILSAPQAAPVEQTTKVFLRIREILDDLDLNTNLDRRHAREAFLATIDVRIPEQRPAAEQAQCSTVRQIVEFLLELTAEEVAAANILEFLSRMALLRGESGGAALTERVKLLSHDLPTFEEELHEITERLGMRSPRLQERPHFLVRIERDIDCDPDEPGKDQSFTVTGWKYTADKFGWMRPVTQIDEFSKVQFTTRATGSELADRIRARLPLIRDVKTVLELMVDGTALVTPLIDGLIRDLTSDLAVVVRPLTPSADETRWFANWESALRGTDFQPALYDHDELVEAPTCSALVINSYHEPTRLPALLLAAGVPIAAWKQRGGFIEASAESCVRAKFDTPELFQSDRRDGRLSDDSVLMWHNPHWFPNGQALQWRGAPA